MKKAHPLARLDGVKLGGYRLELGALEPTRLSGWRLFVFLLKRGSRVGDEPLAEGVYSAGGKGVRPWIEVVHFSPRIKMGRTTIHSRKEKLDLLFLQKVSSIIPSGGHAMVWYETEAFRDTHDLLQIGIPAVATPLGCHLFQAGFRRVRNFHVPEGGHEGGRKLWGEKPAQHDSLREMAAELREFCSRESSGLYPRLEAEARSRARIILKTLGLTPASSASVDRLTNDG